MLTSQEALSRIDFAAGRIYPDRLTKASHRHYLDLAEQLLAVYRDGVGQTRQRLHQRAETVFDACEDCPSRRMAAFIKLLDETSTFETDRGRKAAELRQRVFRAAAPHHPLVDIPSGVFGAQQWTVKEQIARELGKPWQRIEQSLFSDVIEFHTLESFEGYPDGASLLARYNVAQVQACLYRSTRMTIRTSADLKAIVRQIKLARLMHTITRMSDGTYQFILNGPASALRETRRYGVAMAKLIPGLIACRDWRLSATIVIGKSHHRLAMQLSSQDGLTSPKLPPQEYDSTLESDLMQKWNESPLAGWQLTRETDLLVHDQRVFIPDFVATDESGAKTYIEIVGYWTPEYLQSKVQTLQQFADYRILVLAPEGNRNALDGLPQKTLESIMWYKTKISFKEFRKALIACQ